MNIALISLDIKDFDIKTNIFSVEEAFSCLEKDTDMVVLPEMFLTGFVMDTTLAQQSKNEGLKLLKHAAKQYCCAMEGTLLIQQNNKYYNRHYFITSEKVQYYDKKHLFSMSDESKKLNSGTKHTIVEYKGWKIMLLTCYDLRFADWSKNKITDNKFLYDILVYCASWPKSRIRQWQTLLQARAIENQSFVIGVNRQGKDYKNNIYPLSSYLINPKGEILKHQNNKTLNNSNIQYYDINKESLNRLRQNFPVSLDW